MIVLLIAGVAGYFLFFRAKPDTSVMPVSGRIEGYETNVGAKIGGRVDFVKVREGEAVHQGDWIVQISDADTQAQLKQSIARIAKAKEEAEQRTYQVAAIESQIQEAKLVWGQTVEDSGAEIKQAEANVARSSAQLSEAHARLQEARSDLQLALLRKQRYKEMVDKGAVTLDEYDQVRTTSETSQANVISRQANVEAATKELKAAQAQLLKAKSTRISPAIRMSQLQSLNKQLLQATHQLKAAKHEIEEAQAQKEEILANLAYLKVLSPISGVVTARAVEPGAVVVSGQNLLSLIDLNNVYLRGYIPEGQIGKVRLGQKAKVFLDSDPQKPFDGSVVQIDPQGSFTPENIYFKDDRVKQVFGIKIAIDNPGGYVKPGMPADGQIILH